MLIEESEEEGINHIVEYDWDSNEIWRWRPDQRGIGGRLSDQQSHYLHHDFELMPNGELLAMYSVPVPEEILETVVDVDWPYFGRIRRQGLQLIGDELVYVTREGEETWKWAAHDHIDINDFAPAWRRIIDWSHGNSVRAVPENKWYDAGDERFKPGNVIYNTRNLPNFWVISRETGEITYQGGHRYLGGLAGQHEAHMIPKGLPGAGNFLVFDNGAYSPDEDHIGRTLIVEIDPVENRIVWKYEASGRSWRFFSRSRGSVQRLPNGNTLISEDNTGRIFQVRPDENHPDGGEVVWEYVAFNAHENPLWALARAQAYPYDFCQQLMDLPRSELRVTPPSGSEWKIQPDAMRDGQSFATPSPPVSPQHEVELQGGVAVAADGDTSVSPQHVVELQENLLIVATSESFSLAGELTDFLANKSVSYRHVEPEEFDPFHEALHIAIIAGIDERESVRALAAKALGDEQELAWLAEPGNNAIYNREDTFADGQKIMLIAGSSPAAAVDGLAYYRNQWLARLATWLEIQLTREEIYSY